MTNSEYLDFLRVIIEKTMAEYRRVYNLMVELAQEQQKTNIIMQEVNELAKSEFLTPEYILKVGRI